jgi:hypothetical protein
MALGHRWQRVVHKAGWRWSATFSNDIGVHIRPPNCISDKPMAAAVWDISVAFNIVSYSCTL